MSAPKYFAVLEWEGADESDYAIVGPFEQDEHRDWFCTMFTAAEFNGWDNWGWQKVGDIYGSYDGPVANPAEFIQTRPRNPNQWSAARARIAQLKAMGFDVSRALAALKVPGVSESKIRVASKETMAVWSRNVVEGVSQAHPLARFFPRS